MSKTRLVPIKDFFVGENQPLTIISGPCVIENEEQTLFCAKMLKSMMHSLGVNFIFKACYDKANRLSLNSFRGPGIDEGLKILQKVKKEFDLPVISDVHTTEEMQAASQVLDVIQIPAFLSRQTDLVVAAAQTGLPIHIKKGQFMAPWDMENIVEKITACGNNKIIIADRGTSFGYNTLVSDFRSIPIMQRFGFPVCFDATHSVQKPGGLGSTSGGDREFIPTLAKAAVAAGCDAIFIESHPNPKDAKSDSSIAFPLSELASLIKMLKSIYNVVRE